jgi:tetratricopeptide (TPR) repeat protein
LFEDEMDFAFDESMPPPPSEDDSKLDQGSNMGGEDEMAFTFDEPDETEFVAPEDDFSFDVAAIEDETESMTSTEIVSSDSFVASNEFESVDVVNDAVSEPEEINIAQISDDSGFTDSLPDQDVMQVIESDTVIPPDSSQLTEYDQFSEATDDTGYEQYISDDFDSGFNDTSSDPIEDNALERGSDVYFDSELTQTPGELARQTGPRIIDPVKEPAQKWVNARLSSKAVDTEAVIVSAKRALKLRRYDAALEMYTALYEKNDKDPVVLMGLAVSQQNTGQIELAMQTYEKLLELDPDNHDAMVNMLGLLRKQFPEVALRRLINLYSQHPDKPGIAAQIGIVQADLGEFSEAMRYLAIASSIEPNNAQHVFNMAIVADKMGDRKAAVTYYQEALELDTIYGRGQSVPRKSIFDRLAVLRR